jgi:two-component system sensor histidine kinase TctE
MVLVMVLLLWIGVAWTLHPLERLRRSLRARAPDDLKPLDPRGVPQEVVPLVDAVNHHIAGHRRMLAEHSQFLADASHQLRTPLGILSIQAAYAVRESDVDRMRESLHAIVAQLARTRRLSEQLLALAHATQEDEGGSPRALPVVDLNAIARGVVLQYLPLARENEQDLGWVGARREGAAPEGTPAADDSDGEEELEGGPPVVPVAADGAEVHEILANLVHNAIKYTPRGGRITVSVRRDAWQGFAEVRDSGPGIEPARRASVFERFQRITPGPPAAGGHGAQGAGLGLTIARSYARRNGGDVELGGIVDLDHETGGADIFGSGLRATLWLPLSSPSGLPNRT